MSGYNATLSQMTILSEYRTIPSPVAKLEKKQF